MDGPFGEGHLDAARGAAQEMRMRRSALLRIVLAFAVAVALLTILPLGLTGGDVHQRSSLSKRGDGYFGLVELARALGYGVARHRATYGQLPPPGDALLVTLDPLPARTLERFHSAHVDAAQRRMLATWVESGGHVVAALPGRPVGAWVASDAEPPTLDPQSDPLAALLGTKLPETTWVPANGELRGARELRGLRAPWPPTGTDAPAAAAHVDTGDEAVRVRAFTGLPEGVHGVLWMGEHALVVATTIGRGEVWVASTALPFSNYALGRLRLGRLAVRVLHEASDAGRRRIAFDEYCHGLTDVKSVWWWVWNTGLLYPVAGICLLLVLLAWRGSSRVGAARSDAIVARRSKEEFVISIADLGRRAGRHRSAARGILAGYELRLRGRGAAGPWRSAAARLEDRVGHAGFGAEDLAELARAADAAYDETVRHVDSPDGFRAGSCENAPA